MCTRTKKKWTGIDKRTGKRVIIIGEVAGHKLFSGIENHPLSHKQIMKLADGLILACKEHRIDAKKLGLSLCELGAEIYYRFQP